MQLPRAEEKTESEEEFRTVLGMRIKGARKALKMKQETFSYRLNVSQATASRWEQGKNAPGAQMLARIADLLCVSMDSLCGRSSSLGPGCAIVNLRAMRELETAAERKASISSVKHLMYPAALAIAHLVPHDSAIVPPEGISQLNSKIERLYAMLVVTP